MESGDWSSFREPGTELTECRGQEDRTQNWEAPENPPRHQEKPKATIVYAQAHVDINKAGLKDHKHMDPRPQAWELCFIRLKGVF